MMIDSHPTSWSYELSTQEFLVTSIYHDGGVLGTTEKAGLDLRISDAVKMIPSIADLVLIT